MDCTPDPNISTSDRPQRPMRPPIRWIREDQEADNVAPPGDVDHSYCLRREATLRMRAEEAEATLRRVSLAFGQLKDEIAKMRTAIARLEESMRRLRPAHGTNRAPAGADRPQGKA